MGRIYAAADLGSNTAHLLIATPHAKKGLKRIVNQSDWLSLGEAVSREGRVPENLEAALLESLRRFKLLAYEASVDGMYVFATEAMRRAANCKDLLKRVKQETGLTVELISPEREAELGLRGAQIDTHQAPETLMVEAGGGSVQAALVIKGVLKKDVSLPLGTGALIAACGLAHPAPKEKVDALEAHIHHAIQALEFELKPSHMVAVGGVARGVWRAMHPDKNRVLHLRELQFLAWDVARLDVLEICKRYGVKEKRAATLLPGAMIYAALMEKFGQQEIEVSQFGVREGAILEMAQKDA